MKSLKFTRRRLRISVESFATLREGEGFDISNVKCSGMDFALITPSGGVSYPIVHFHSPTLPRVLVRHLRNNDSAPNTIIYNIIRQ